MTVATPDFSRRGFLRRALLASAAGVAVPIAALTERAEAAEEGASPYGDIADRDGSGVLLPAGFTAQVVAVSNEVVPGTDYVYRGWPDGAATFTDLNGGWFHTVNHELRADDGGGVTCLHFDATGTVIDAYSILEGTNRNCAGGPTPWGTWLSCEEVASGLVWECAPGRQSQGIALPALGVFNHEAVAVDPVRRHLYLTEDRGDGLLYRFIPDEYPGLLAGRLEAAVVNNGQVTWAEIPDPSASAGETRYQRLGETTPFNGGEGIWYHNDHIYFTTKGDNGVWDLNVATSELVRIWSGNPGDSTADQLTGVDNITVESGSGDLYVAEDGGNMELVLITPEGTVSPFLRVEGQPGSEITGPVFTPDGTQLLFSSQRGATGAGITYLVSGPFRGTAGVPAVDPNTGSDSSEAPDDTAAPVTDESMADTEPDEGSDESTETDEAPAPAPTSTPDTAPAAKADSNDGVDTQVDPEADDEPMSGDTETAETASAQSSSTTVAEDPANAADTDAPVDTAQSVDLDPSTPDPGATFTGVASTDGDGRTALFVGGGVVAAGLAGAGLLAMRRRTERDANSASDVREPSDDIDASDRELNEGA